MNKRNFLLMSILFFSQILFSQKSIHGTVIDSKSKEILSYVNIGIPNENVGTVSSENGQFNLRLPDTISRHKEICFSFIGYKTKAVHLFSLLKKGEVTIELERDSNQLNEVVINLKKA